MSNLRDAFVALDAALTGRVPTHTADSRKLKTLADLFEQPGGIIYLSDEGYSLLLVDFSYSGKPLLRLSQDSKERVKEAWERCKPEREKLIKELTLAASEHL